MRRFGRSGARGLLAGLICAALALVGAAQAAPGRARHVEAALISAQSGLPPGGAVAVALRQKIEPGWHTYWRNPGDSGEATEIVWTLPKGFSVSPPQWPPPRRLPVGPLMNFGYSDEVILPMVLRAPAEAPAGPVVLKAHARWLVCAEICVPEEADLTLDLQIGAQGGATAWSAPIAAANASIPKPAGVAAHWTKQDDEFRLTATGGPLPTRADAETAAFFPYSGDAIDHAAPQRPEQGPKGFAFTLKPGSDFPAALAGVLTLQAKDGALHAYEIMATEGAPLPDAGGTPLSEGARAAESSPVPPLSLSTPLTPAAPKSSGGGVGLGLALLLAFAGGLLLNIMPCVLPILSMKALHLAQASEPEPARREGVAYLVGVMISMLSLAALLIALKAGGAALGWGFQLQQPLVVAALALLFFAIGLHLLGTWTFGAGAQNFAAARGSGAFLTGALAVAAATPCTAPFMGAALGFAATQPPATALSVFAALGLGFAAPLTAFSFSPRLRRFLPKPGRWMDVLKQALAFPMFAAAIWLAWVLTQQRGPDAALTLLAGGLAIGAAAWAQGAFRGWPRTGIALAALAVLAAAGFSLSRLPLMESRLAGPLSAEAWSPAREAELRQAGRPVFVNFTAAWCITCQVNERLALRSDAVAAAFAESKTAYLKADWTSRDAAIEAALRAQGRDGVPLYLYYAPGAAAPLVLPQILTPDLVARTIRGQAGG